MARQDQYEGEKNAGEGQGYAEEECEHGGEFLPPGRLGKNGSRKGHHEINEAKYSERK